MEGHKESSAGQRAAQIEDTPAPGRTAWTDAQLHEQAVRLDCLRLAQQMVLERGSNSDAVPEIAKGYADFVLLGQTPVRPTPEQAP